MKPLTIDDLKALQMGDWVWVETINAPNSQFRGYYQIRPNSERSKLIFCGIEHDYSIIDYGTKWLAYKNKEQAEANGEIMELPCIRVIERKAGKLYEVVYVQIGGMIGNETYPNKFNAERRLKELKGE